MDHNEIYLCVLYSIAGVVEGSWYHHIVLVKRGMGRRKQLNSTIAERPGIVNGQRLCYALPWA